MSRWKHHPDWTADYEKTWGDFRFTVVAGADSVRLWVEEGGIEIPRRHFAAVLEALQTVPDPPEWLRAVDR